MTTQSKPDQDARKAAEEKTRHLAQIIKPLRSASYEVDSDWRWFDRYIQSLANDYGGLEYTPDFQRGHVWSTQQQTHYIENALRGVINTGGFVVQFNCPNWDNDNYRGDLPRGLQCIDGLQRITAVAKFMDGEIKPFGLHVDDLNNSAFSIGPKFRFRIAIHNIESKRDLLAHYLDLNTGGTPHSQAEIERVRAMKENCERAQERYQTQKSKGPSL